MSELERLCYACHQLFYELSTDTYADAMSELFRLSYAAHLDDPRSWLPPTYAGTRRPHVG